MTQHVLVAQLWVCETNYVFNQLENNFNNNQRKEMMWLYCYFELP